MWQGSNGGRGGQAISLAGAAAKEGAWPNDARVCGRVRLAWMVGVMSRPSPPVQDVFNSCLAMSWGG